MTTAASRSGSSRAVVRSRSTDALPAAPGGTAWRIERYGGGARQTGEGGEGGNDDERYAVYRGAKRLVWGLRARRSAARWLQRLGGPAQLAVDPDESRGSRRVSRAWWNS